MVTLFQFNAGILIRMEWYLANQANLEAEHHHLPLQKLDTTWSLPPLHFMAENRTCHLLLWSKLFPLPYILYLRRKLLQSVSPCSLQGSLYWPTSDSSPRRQHVSMAQGCGRLVTEPQDVYHREPAALSGDLQKLSPILFSAKSIKQFLLLSKGRVGTAVYLDHGVTMNRWSICNTGQRHVSFAKAAPNRHFHQHPHTKMYQIQYLFKILKIPLLSARNNSLAYLKSKRLLRL